MIQIILFTFFFSLSGCATAELGREVTQEQTKWIQKGITTRSEVVARFGAPNFEFTDYAASQYQTTTTSTTTNEGNKSTTTTTVQVEPPKSTKATYLHTKSESAVLPFYAHVETTQKQFWVRYDDKGIVEDFGFSENPGLTGH